AADAVKVDRLIGGIVDDAEKFRQLRSLRLIAGGPGTLDVLHPGPLDKRAFIGVGVAAGQIDDRLHPEGGEIRVVTTVWLRSPEIVRVDLPEVADANGWRSDSSRGRRVRARIGAGRKRE